MKGSGCDRHLLGLYLIAMENGLELPEIFTDPSFTRSGGGGNYILSTSCKFSKIFFFMKLLEQTQLTCSKMLIKCRLRLLVDMWRCSADEGRWLCIVLWY